MDEYRTPKWVKAALFFLLIGLIGCFVMLFKVNNAVEDLQQQYALVNPDNRASKGVENKQPGIVSLENSADMVEMVSPSVVNIEASRTGAGNFPNNPFFEEFFGDILVPKVENSIGTGFIISKEGHVVTNQHVINEAEDIKVNLNDGRQFKAEVVGQDYEMDLAVLKINADNDLIPLQLGDSEELRVGEWVIAIGNPYGLDHTVTAGVVSAKGRPMQIEDRIYKDLIQTDAAINPGNSGGPLLNTRGEVVGINTAVNAQAQGIGFAISINTARDILDELIKNGKVIRPYIGIYLQEVDKEIAEELNIEKKGIVVIGVENNSPAAKAGIKKYDVITSINGKQVNNYDELQEILRDLHVGDTVRVQIIREGRPISLELTLAEKP